MHRQLHKPLVADSQASTEMLIRLLYLRHGFALFDSGISLWLMTAGSVAVAQTKAVAGDAGCGEKQRQQDADAALSTIILCARGG